MSTNTSRVRLVYVQWHLTMTTAAEPDILLEASTVRSGGPEQHGDSLGNSSSSSDTHFVELSDAGFSFIAFMLTLTFVLGSFVNGLCLFVFAKNKRLRSPTNIFVMALNLCDLLMCLVGIPMSMTSAYAHHWLWGELGCDIEAFIVYFLGLSSMYVLMAISFDRYIAISRPLLGTKITKKVAVISCGACYLLGFLWSIFPAFGWNEFTLEGAGISCSVNWENPSPVYTSYIYAIFFFCFVIPVGVMMYSYYGIIATLRSLNKSSVWDMDSRVARRNLAIERKMMKTACLIVLAFWVCWLPYTIVSFVAAFLGGDTIPVFLATIPPVIAKCQGLLNPIIYVATNKQLRTGLYESLPCESLKSSLLKGEEDKPEEAESDESDLDEGEGSSKKAKGKKNASDGKKDGEKKKKKSGGGGGGGGGGKKNAVHPAVLEKPSVDEGVSEMSTLDGPAMTSTSIQITQDGNNAQVSYSSGGAAP
ncbi:pinopsin-like [Aplysia californica]|uniref:Pinopsin-like n=1 Tax=Aplysia californica TaxID=6500 RepID=A0ABM1A1M1_APLCA|nr:pinopsin-like [Aplysia californica]